MAKTSEDRLISWKEVAQNNTRESAWVSINGTVYDVTSWISKHPGGEQVMLLSAGRDITQVFEMYHWKNPRAEALLKKFAIGKLIDHELPHFPPKSEFHKTIQERVRNYFQTTGQDSKFHPFMMVRYGLVLTGWIAGWYFSFYSEIFRSSYFLSFLASVLLGYTCAQIGFLPTHDGSHCAFTHSPRIWFALSMCNDFFNGASHFTWFYQHILGHHPYTNINGADPDISTNEPDVRRIKPSQPWYKHYISQEFFVPFLYGLLALKTRTQDFTILFGLKANDKIRVNPFESHQLIAFWAGKIFFVSYRILLPLLIESNSFVRVMMLLVISDLVTSYTLALTFQANHVVDEMVWPVPDAKKYVNMDWAEMQVRASQDYAHDKIVTNFVGALNYQVAHHLFPDICQHYYPAVGRIIREVCDEFGVRYIVKNSLSEALGTHLRHLKIMGQQPKQKV